MSATINMHAVSGIRDIRTDTICGNPRLGFTLDSEGDPCGFCLSAFIDSPATAAAIGAALIVAGTELVRTYGVKAQEVA